MSQGRLLGLEGRGAGLRSWVLGTRGVRDKGSKSLAEEVAEDSKIHLQAKGTGTQSSFRSRCSPLFPLSRRTALPLPLHHQRRPWLRLPTPHQRPPWLRLPLPRQPRPRLLPPRPLPHQCRPWLQLPVPDQRGPRLRLRLGLPGTAARASTTWTPARRVSGGDPFEGVVLVLAFQAEKPRLRKSKRRPITRTLEVPDL